MDAVLEKIQLNTLLAGSLLACLIFFPKFIQQVHGISKSFDQLNIINDSQDEIIFIALSNECACPGDTLIYECTVVGVPNGATIWRGTAFECLSNEIALLHSRFVNGTLNFGICNNGAIVARSLSVEGNNYTSQLNVTVTPDTAAKTIICFNDDPFNSTIQFSTVTPNFTTGNFHLVININ